MYSFPIYENYWGPRVTAPASFQSIKQFRKIARMSPMIVGLLLVCLLVAPSQVDAAQIPLLSTCPVKKCSDNSIDPAFDPSTDYYPIKVTSAQPDFTIQYFNSYKVIINNAVRETYVLYQCGTPKPVLSINQPSKHSTHDKVIFDSSLDQVINNRTKYFTLPIDNLAIDGSVGSVVLSYLEILGVRQSIKRMDTTYVVSPCINVMVRNGTILPYPSSANQSVSLVLYGNSGSSLPNSISIAASAENQMLERAGWIQLIGTFFNREAAALSLTNSINENYWQLSEVAVTQSVQPVVAWVSVYGQSYTIAYSDYRKDLTLDGGAQQISASFNRSITYTNANSFKSMLSNVDYLIDESYFANPFVNSSTVLQNLGLNATDLIVSSSPYKFIRQSSVWRLDGIYSFDGDTTDWFESAIAQPDAVLADFLRVVHPSVPTPFNQVIPSVSLWFRNIFNQTINQIPLVCSAEQAAAPSTPLWEQYTSDSIDQINCPAYLMNPGQFGGVNRTLAGCATLGCIDQDEYDQSTNYFPVSLTSNANEFWMRYYSSYKFIYNNLTGTDETYVLYQCGTPVPSTNSSAAVPIDQSIRAFIDSNTRFFSVPVQRVGIDSAVGRVATNFMELLGVRHTISYLDTTYSTSSCIDYLGALNTIGRMSEGDEEFEEQYKQVDLLMVGNADSSRRKAISVAVTQASSTFEEYGAWLALVAAFFNKEATAQALLSQQQSNIQSLKQLISQQPSKPIVAFVDYESYRSPPIWSIDSTDRLLTLITAAGGQPLNTTFNSFTDVEAFHNALASVDCLIDQTYFPAATYNQSLTALGFTAQDVASGRYKFINQSRFFRVDARKSFSGLGDDWYESGVAQTDAVLADFVRVTHPSIVTPFTNAQPSYLWFRNIARNEPITTLPAANQCIDPFAPIMPLWQSYPNNQIAPNTGYTCPAYLLNPAAYPRDNSASSPFVSQMLFAVLAIVALMMM